MPRKAETYTVEPVVTPEAVSSVDLVDRGVGCAVDVAAVRASAEPVSPSTCMAKTEVKTMPATGEVDPRPVQPW